jgi:hypothetical protein
MYFNDHASPWYKNGAVTNRFSTFTKETSPMKQSVLSFLLVLAIEAVCAIASYLKNRLIHQMRRDQQDTGFESEFA